MEFNYIIGRYWDNEDGSICVYTVANNSTHYGTLEDAEAMLAYVNGKNNEIYQIFKIGELNAS